MAFGRFDPPRAKIATAISVSVGHRNEAYVVGKPVQCSGLMFDRRARREQPFHSVLAGMALGHHAEQVVATVGRDEIAAVEALQEVDHCFGGAGIPGVPKVALVCKKLSDRPVDVHALDSILHQPLVNRVGPPTSLNSISAARLSL